MKRCLLFLVIMLGMTSCIEYKSYEVMYTIDDSIVIRDTFNVQGEYLIPVGERVGVNHMFFLEDLDLRYDDSSDGLNRLYFVGAFVPTDIDHERLSLESTILKSSSNLKPISVMEIPTMAIHCHRFIKFY